MHRDRHLAALLSLGMIAVAVGFLLLLGHIDPDLGL